MARPRTCRQSNGVFKRATVSSVDDFLGAVVFVDEGILCSQATKRLIKDAIPSYVLLFNSSGLMVTSWGRRAPITHNIWLEQAFGRRDVGPDIFDL